MTIDDKLAVQAAEEHLRQLRSGELFANVWTDDEGDTIGAPDTARAEDAIERLLELVRRLSPPAPPSSLAIAA